MYIITNEDHTVFIRYEKAGHKYIPTRSEKEAMFFPTRIAAEKILRNMVPKRHRKGLSAQMIVADINEDIAVNPFGVVLEAVKGQLQLREENDDTKEESFSDTQKTESEVLDEVSSVKENLAIVPDIVLCEEDIKNDTPDDISVTSTYSQEAYVKRNNEEAFATIDDSDSESNLTIPELATKTEENNEERSKWTNDISETTKEASSPFTILTNEERKKKELELISGLSLIDTREKEDLVSLIKSLFKTITEIDKKINRLNMDLKKADRMVVDLYHFCEFEDDTDDATNVLFAKALRNILSQRRDIKDELEVWELLKGCDISCDMPELKKLAERKWEKKYMYREFPELFV